MESDYTGPRLDGDITAEFMTELVTHLRDQKKLHKKYAYKVSIGREGGRVGGMWGRVWAAHFIHTVCMYAHSLYMIHLISLQIILGVKSLLSSLPSLIDVTIPEV